MVRFCALRDIVKTVFVIVVASVYVGYAGTFATADRLSPENPPDETGEADGKRAPMETINDLPRGARMALYTAQMEREEGNFDEAGRILEEYLKEHPEQDNYLIRYHTANTLVQAGRREDALVQYQAAMKMEDRFMQGWLNMGELAYNLAHYDLAASSILRGYDLNPDKPPNLLFHAAAAYIMGDKPQMAVPFLKELVSGSRGEPKMEWFRALVSAALRMEDKALGNEAIRAMLDAFPEDPDAWFLAFQHGAATGDFRSAAVALTVVGYLKPLARDERIQLGNIYNAIGIPYQASVLYRAALADSASMAEMELLASAYLAAHDTDAAMQTLRTAIEKAPSVRLWSLLGDLYYMNQDYERSVEAFSHCVLLDSNHSRAYLMMGYCALESGDKQEALRQFELAAAFPEQEEKARYLIARIGQSGN